VRENGANGVAANYAPRVAWTLVVDQAMLASETLSEVSLLTPDRTA